MIYASHHILERVRGDFYTDLVDHEKLHNLLSALDTGGVRALLFGSPGLTIDHEDDVFVKCCHFSPKPRNIAYDLVF